MVRPDNNSTRPTVSSSLTTEVQAESHRGGRKRMIWAGVVALAGLILLVFLGPDEQAVKERFEYYGAPGELKIMPEISIEEGNQNVHQIPKSLQIQPPPANIEVEIEDPTEDGTEEIPPVNIQEPNQVEIASDVPHEDAELSSESLVEMAMPMQSNPDYYILHLVRPEYPPEAREAERRTPVIFVNVVIFVGPDGLVSDAWVNSTNGSRLFVDATLEAVRQWKFGWRIDPGIGRQYVIPWRFKSPYFIPQSRQP
ncbi:MAG: TonB family protein [Candidatus Krumholzibacteriota bacterium]